MLAVSLIIDLMVMMLKLCADGKQRKLCWSAICSKPSFRRRSTAHACWQRPRRAGASAGLLHFSCFASKLWAGQLIPLLLFDQQARGASTVAGTDDADEDGVSDGQRLHWRYSTASRTLGMRHIPLIVLIVPHHDVRSRVMCKFSACMLPAATNTIHADRLPLTMLCPVVVYAQTSSKSSTSLSGEAVSEQSPKALLVSFNLCVHAGSHACVQTHSDAWRCAVRAHVSSLGI